MDRLHRFMRSLFGLLMLAAALPAYADIYKYVDADGHVTFTNIPIPGSQRMISERPNSPGPKTSVSNKPKHRTVSPADFPRIDRATQKQRDGLRRNLLLEELQSEQKSLDSAKNQVARQRTGPELEKLNESVRLHEKNIEMLNKELANIR